MYDVKMTDINAHETIKKLASWVILDHALILATCTMGGSKDEWVHRVMAHTKLRNRSGYVVGIVQRRK